MIRGTKRAQFDNRGSQSISVSFDAIDVAVAVAVATALLKLSGSLLLYY